MPPKLTPMSPSMLQNTLQIAQSPLPSPLAPLKVPRRPKTTAETPAVPQAFTPSQIISPSTDEYALLKHRAIANNAHTQEKHEGKAWAKQKLTEEERFYLWNAQGGNCGNSGCREHLDQKTMTIEHIVPKSKYPEGMWDIRNFTILCRSCNSKKKDNHAPFKYNPTSVVASKCTKWAEK